MRGLTSRGINIAVLHLAARDFPIERYVTVTLNGASATHEAHHSRRANLRVKSPDA